MIDLTFSCQIDDLANLFDLYYTLRQNIIFLSNNSAVCAMSAVYLLFVQNPAVYLDLL